MKGRHEHVHVGWGPDDADQMALNQAMAMVRPKGPETWPMYIVGAMLTVMGGVTGIIVFVSLLLVLGA